MTEKRSDNELVREVQSGRWEVFAELVRRHHPRLVGLCASMLGGMDDAEDAAQEIFLKVYRNLDGFRGDAKFSTWLYRMAHNQCYDMLRKRKRRPTESWDQLVADYGDQIERLFKEDGGMESQTENFDLIARVFGTLKEDFRSVLVLREINGMSYEEMAEELNTTVDAVKSRLKRARKDLMEKAQPYLQMDPGTPKEVS